MKHPKKKRIGRPPRAPGQDYTIRDIPKEAFQRFRQACRREKATMRAVLIQAIRDAPSSDWSGLKK